MSDEMLRVLEVVFGGDEPVKPLGLLPAASRSVVVYLLGIAIVRAGKSRLTSRTTALDILLGFILGSLLSRAITGSAAMSTTAVAAATLVLAHWLLTKLSCWSHGIGKLLKGQPRRLIHEGQIDRDALRASNLSEHDLIEEVRLNGNLEDLKSVHAAYKERSGEISIVKQPTAPQIIDIEVAQGVQTVRLKIGS